LELARKHILDVGRSEENTLEVDIASLYIDPVVEDYSDFLEFVIPGNDFLLEYLVVGGHLHRGKVVDILIDLCEKVVPATDQLAFGLVFDQFELVLSPGLLDTVEELFKDKFSTGLVQDLSNKLFILIDFSMPEVTEHEFGLLNLLKMQLKHQILPVAGFHGLAFQLSYKLIHVLVFFDYLSVLREEWSTIYIAWGLFHLLKGRVQQIFNLLLNIGSEWCVVDWLNASLPNFLDVLPGTLVKLKFIFQAVKALGVTEFHL